jgi:hypothetical protein
LLSKPEERHVRVSTLLAAAAMSVLGLAAPAKAGLLELARDPITLHWNCGITPCRSNHLAYKRVYVRDRYLAYDIHTTPARYEMRRTRVMVAPPTVVVAGGRSWHDRWNFGSRSGLVPLPVHGGYRVVRPAQYAWVTRPVLVSPAHASVTRRAPHYAYYPDTIVVQGRGHRWGW